MYLLPVVTEVSLLGRLVVGFFGSKVVLVTSAANQEEEKKMVPEHIRLESAKEFLLERIMTSLKGVVMQKNRPVATWIYELSTRHCRHH